LARKYKAGEDKMNAGALAGLEILVIDDEPFIRKLIGRMFFELGVKHVVDAEDGADGMNKVRQSRNGFDVVICDLEMPNMDGFGFVRLLRNDKTVINPNVPVLILTGHSDEDNIHKSIQLGINGFLTKPVSKTNLEKRIMLALQSPVINPELLKGR
jgi:two-component system, chemotaxis family, chemotaxis protein CheY